MELRTDDLIIAQRPETVGKWRSGEMVKMRDPRKDIYRVTNLYKVVIRNWNKKALTFYTDTTPAEIDAMKAAPPRMSELFGETVPVDITLFTEHGDRKNEVARFVVPPNKNFEYKATRMVADDDLGRLYPLTALTKGGAQVEMVGDDFPATREAVAAYNDTAWRNA